MTRASGSSAPSGGGGGGGTGSILFGDVTGPSLNTFVAMLQGELLSLSAPVTGQAIVWNGSAWVNQAITPAVVTKTADYTAQYTDYYILADATAGAFTVTLPTAVGHTGKEFEVKRTSVNVNVVHVQTTSAQTIDGASPPYDLNAPKQAAKLVSDGSGWQLV